MRRIVILFLAVCTSLPVLFADGRMVQIPHYEKVNAVQLDGSAGTRRLIPGENQEVLETEGLEIEIWGKTGGTSLQLLDKKVPIVTVEIAFNVLTDKGFADICSLMHLKKLSIDCKAKLTTKGFEAIKSLSTLEKLELHSSCIGNAGMLALKDLPKLVSLTLWGMNSLSSKGFQVVGELNSLSNLELLFNETLDVDAMTYISKNTSIVSIRLTGHSEVKADRITPFINKKNIRVFDLSAYNSSAAFAVNELSKIKSLERVKISCEERLTNDDILALAKLPNLVSLEIRGHKKITGHGFSAFLDCPKLSKIDTSYCSIDEEGVHEILKLTSLEELDLSSATGVSDADCEKIASFSNLKRLDLCGCNNITPDGFLKLSGLVDLVYFNAAATTFDDHSSQILEKMVKLKTLWISGTSLTEVGMSNVSRLNELEYLSLSYSSINSATLAPLADMKKLKTLCLEDCKSVGDIGLAHIGKIGSLKELNLEGTGITGEGLRFLSGLKNLQMLNMEYTAINGDCIKHLAHLGIRKLYMGYCWKLGAKSGDYLKKMDNLERVTIVGVTKLQTGLKINGCSVYDNEARSNRNNAGLFEREPEVEPELPEPADPPTPKNET